MSFDVNLLIVSLMYVFAFSGPKASELFIAGCDHYSAFWKLREHFVDEELVLFQMTQKAHDCLHACLLSSVLNPRKTWCFKFEDCVQYKSLCIFPHMSFEIAYVFVYIPP